MHRARASAMRISHVHHAMCIMPCVSAMRISHVYQPSISQVSANAEDRIHASASVVRPVLFVTFSCVRTPILRARESQLQSHVSVWCLVDVCLQTTGCLNQGLSGVCNALLKRDIPDAPLEALYAIFFSM